MGHRPEKLIIAEKRLARLLEVEIRQAIESGHTTFITGMAKGVDLIAAEIVLRLRKHDPRLKLICALPHPGFGQHWGGGWTERFQRVLAEADLERTICPAFSHASYEPRTYQDLFKRCVRQAGIPDANFHSLRHTFATRALEQGMDVVTLSRLLGHATPSVTLDKYGHALNDHKRASVEKLGGVYSAGRGIPRSRDR